LIARRDVSESTTRKNGEPKAVYSKRKNIYSEEDGDVA
jgi:hypothetical protein